MGCSNYAEVLTASTLDNNAQGTTAWTALSGPSVTVNVPASGLVRLSFYFETEAGAGVDAASAEVFEATDFPDGWGNTVTTVDGDSGSAFGGSFEYYPTPGERTYELEYQESGTNTSSVEFYNRRLWVEVVAPPGA